MSYKQTKADHHASRIPFTEFRGLHLILLKNCYRTTSIWLAKWAQIKPKRTIK